jgi:hypothetical protein
MVTYNSYNSYITVVTGITLEMADSADLLTNTWDVVFNILVPGDETCILTVFIKTDVAGSPDEFVQRFWLLT